jgi:capsid protein
MTIPSHMTLGPHTATTRIASTQNEMSDRRIGRWTRRPLVRRSQTWPCAIRAGLAATAFVGRSFCAFVRVSDVHVTMTRIALSAPAAEGRKVRVAAVVGWWAGDVSIAIFSVKGRVLYRLS